MSWSNFQEERWKTDEAAIKAAVEKAGGTYVSADAQSSPAKQLTDVESLIARGAKALIVLAQDAEAIRPAIEKAVAEGIPVVGYDRLIEIPQVFYLTFDNVEVGRLLAREVLKVKPEGNYVFIKGSGADPNANFLFQGSMEVLKPAIDSGKIKNVGEAYHGWLAARQRPAEHGAVPDQEQQQGRRGGRGQRRHGGRRHRGARGAGSRRLGAGLGPGRRQGRAQPRGPRHADRLGVQGRARARPQRGGDRDAARRRQEAERDRGRADLEPGPEEAGHDGACSSSPSPITKDNLNVVIDAGWVTKDVVCQGVPKGRVQGVQLRPTYVCIPGAHRRRDRVRRACGRRSRSSDPGSRLRARPG